MILLTLTLTLLQGGSENLPPPTQVGPGEIPPPIATQNGNETGPPPGKTKGPGGDEQGPPALAPVSKPQIVTAIAVFKVAGTVRLVAIPDDYAWWNNPTKPSFVLYSEEDGTVTTQEVRTMQRHPVKPKPSPPEGLNHRAWMEQLFYEGAECPLPGYEFVEHPKLGFVVAPIKD